MTASKVLDTMQIPQPPLLSGLTREHLAQNIDYDRTMFPHRMSISSTAQHSQSPKMHPKAQPHSHSLSVGSLNPTHRVSRRKSTSANNTNKEAVMAAIAGQTFEPGSLSSKRGGKGFLGPKQAVSSAFPASLPNASGFAAASPPRSDAKSPSAVADGPPLASLAESEKGNSKNRVRRASEGAQVGKAGKRSAAAGELRCETCGKGYKHSSCLTKHLWEHTPEWQYTSKLLISKHQQVQLLEAASVLMAINADAVESDSSSPAASGSSDHHDSEMSSVETTPPPQLEPRSVVRGDFGHTKRLSANSSTYSRSYQSSVFSESVPTSRQYMSHYRQWSSDGRPTTSGTSVSGSYKEDQEQADLAAAVGLLSCSFGTPKTNPVMLPQDVPPVPPLPAQFLGNKADHLSGSTVTMSHTGQSYSYLRARKDNDVEMEDDDEEEHLQRSPGRHRSDDEEEGMFGKMEY